MWPSYFCSISLTVQAIRQRGCIIKYLPPYSPDYSPIELTFSVLKSWIRRHFHEIWPQREETFGDFLHYAIERSRCDQYAKAHFKHAAGEGGGYIFEADIHALEQELLRLSD